MSILVMLVYTSGSFISVDLPFFCFRNNCFRWEDPIEGVFRIVESEKLARLWGEKKNNQKMTYEKLSRAMRFVIQLIIAVVHWNVINLFAANLFFSLDERQTQL